MPTRLFELSLYRPVLAPDTGGIRDYFDDDRMLFLEPGNVQDLAEKIIWVYVHQFQTSQFVRAGNAVYQEHLWQREKSRFLKLIAEEAHR